MHFEPGNCSGKSANAVKLFPVKTCMLNYVQKYILNVCHVKCVFQIGEGEVSIAPRCLVHQTCDVLLLSVTCALPRPSPPRDRCRFSQTSK